LHDADASHHRRAAKRSDQDQGLHGRLPFLGFVLGVRKFRDVERGVDAAVIAFNGAFWLRLSAQA
jgi:hypothetical protein